LQVTVLLASEQHCRGDSIFHGL